VDPRVDTEIIKAKGTLQIYIRKTSAELAVTK
jgi:hypothetical protein